MKKYKVIESCDVNDIEKISFTGDLEECKNWLFEQCLDSWRLIEILEFEKVDIKKFIIAKLAGEGEDEDGHLKKRLEKCDIEELKERFQDSYHGNYKYILTEDKTPVIFSYGITEA